MTTALAEQLSTVSLYERLGASAGIRRIVDSMVDAHLQIPVIQARFQPDLDDPDRVEQTKHNICKFFETHSDGPDPYQGHCMVDAYPGMHINAVEYMAAVDDILRTMKALGYDAETHNEVHVTLYGVKDDIIRV